MPDYTGPLPLPTPESRPFWDAARRHVLELPRCRSCGQYHYYPRATCPHCLSADLEWRGVSGRGRLHTFTIVQRGSKGFPIPTPYVMAVVEPDERSAAAGITGIARTTGAAISPSISAVMVSSVNYAALPFYLAGGLKIVYDLLVYRDFRNLKPPEERRA